VLLALAAVSASQHEIGTTAVASTPTPDPIATLCAHLTPEGRKALGVDAAQLRPDGHELARAFLKPLAKDDGAPSEDDRLRAALIMKSQVKILTLPVQDLGWPINWLRIPQGADEGGDFWTGELNLHYRWLPPLARVYRATGDEVMARKCVDIILDWIAHFPLPANQVTMSVNGITLWSGFHVSHRGDAWVYMLRLLRDSQALDNRAVAIILNSILDDHRRVGLADARSGTGNQYLSLASWLTSLNRDLPWFEGNTEAERIGWERIADYTRRYIYPDGSNAECSPGYAAGSTRRLFGMIEEAERRGFPIPDGRERVRLSMRYFALIADPLGRSPRIAHSGSGKPIREFLGRLNESFHDPEVAFVASGGKEGKAPAQLNVVFPWSGHAVFRSGWDENATWLFFEPGPRGAGHYDLSQNGVQLVANGEWLLCDPGYYTYETAGPTAAMSAYLKTTAAHNCALVDGKGQLPVAQGQKLGVNNAPGEYLWSEDANTVSVEGAYTYGFAEPLKPWEVHKASPIPVVHRRRVTFHKREQRFIIEDRFDGEGNHRVDIHWQGYPGAKTATGEGRFSLAGNKARLDATVKAPTPLAITVVEGRKNPLGGWYSEDANKLAPAPMIIVTAKGALPLRVVTELRVGNNVPRR